MGLQPQPSQVVPNFWVESVESLRDFYLEKLGFEHRMGIVGKDGKLDFAIVRLNETMVMMGRPQRADQEVASKSASGQPVEVYIYLEDVDAYHARVEGRVEISQPLTTQWWGDRNFAVRDPYGYTLWFCQLVSSLVPPPGMTVI